MYGAASDDSPFVPPIPSASPSAPSSAGATSSDYTGYPSVNGDVPHSYSPTTYSPHHPFVPSDPPNRVVSPWGYPINAPFPQFSPQLWAPLPPRGIPEQYSTGPYSGIPVLSDPPSLPAPASPSFSNNVSGGRSLPRPRAFQSPHMPSVHEDGPQNPRFIPQTQNPFPPGFIPRIPVSFPPMTPAGMPPMLPGSGMGGPPPWFTPPQHVVANSPMNHTMYPAFQHPGASPGSILKASPGGQSSMTGQPVQVVQHGQSYPRWHPSEAAFHPHAPPGDAFNGPTADPNRDFASGPPVPRPGWASPVLVPVPETYGLTLQVAAPTANPTKPVNPFEPVSGTIQINPLLVPPTDADRPHLKWDMTHPTKYGDFAVELESHLWQPATPPATTSLFVVSEDFPWMITIDASRADVGVTCTDVINGVAECMYCLANEQDYKYVSDSSGGSIEENYRRNRSRSQGIPGLQQGIRRLDWLGLKSAFGGIEPNDALVKTTLCDDAAPFTFVLLRQEISPRDDRSDSPPQIRPAASQPPVIPPIIIFEPPATPKIQAEKTVFKKLLKSFSRPK